MGYIVTAIFSTQVGEDSWRVVSAHKNLNENSTIKDVFDWIGKKSVTSMVRIELAEIED